MASTRLVVNSPKLKTWQSPGDEKYPDFNLWRLKAEPQFRYNLLRAVETAKVEARDASRSAQIEARLRGEITNLRSEREDALASAAESKRKANLLEEEVRLVKAKLGRLAQEKLRQERDSRAALSLARSMDSHAMADTDFYKRKAAELSERLQSQQALAAEQKYQLDEMKRKMARNVTKNRLAEIRSEGVREMRR
eukprot:scaffold200084_cov36-Attheya_sp.AAC.2